MAMKAKLVPFLALLVLVFCTTITTTEAKKLKTTNIQFYMHDVISGPNATAVEVARPGNSTNADGSFGFGSVFVMDNPLTVAPERNSTVLARAQGLYANSEQNGISLLMSLTVHFITGPYNGSTFSVLGRNPIMNEVREMPIVGGTGIFRLARGYCFASTLSFAGFNAVIGYNVTLLHF